MGPDDYKPVLPNKIKITVTKSKPVKKKGDWIDPWIRQQINKIRKTIQLNAHRTHLMVHISHLTYLNNICNHPLVQPFSLSISQTICFEENGNLKKFLKNFCKQFHKVFQVKPRSRQDFISILKEVFQAFETGKISLKLVAVMIAVSWLRSIGLVTRMCYALNPVPITPPDLVNKFTKFKRAQDDVIEDQKFDFREKKTLVSFWIEVFDELNRKWLCMDVVNQTVNDPPALELATPHQISYILAVDNYGWIFEVTPRYASDWVSHSIKKRRQDDDWWKQTLNLVKPSGKQFSRFESADLQEFDEIFAKVPLPTRRADYKCHPLFVLQMDVLKFQAIYPPDAPPVGFFQELPVFSRSCVHVLKSREQWLKEARSIKSKESPYKVVDSGSKKNVELFGEWQTEPYDPPEAKNGRVPRNAYGNVDLFKPCMLPKGTVHLHLPGLWRTAKRLKVDCVPAMIGFDTKKGRTYAVKDGYIVCAQHEKALIRGWHEDNARFEKNSEEQRIQNIYDNWKRLIKGLVIRENLKIKYGG